MRFLPLNVQVDANFVLIMFEKEKKVSYMNIVKKIVTVNQGYVLKLLLVKYVYHQMITNAHSTIMVKIVLVVVILVFHIA